MKKKYWMKTRKDREFRILDIGCDIIVEHCTRKHLVEQIEEYIENLEEGCVDGDTDYTILYKDGSTDYISEDYDGHKIKKIHIVSIVENNPQTSVVFGHYEVNSYGVVCPSMAENIDKTNIMEIV